MTAEVNFSTLTQSTAALWAHVLLKCPWTSRYNRYDFFFLFLKLWKTFLLVLVVDWQLSYKSAVSHSSYVSNSSITLSETINNFLNRAPLVFSLCRMCKKKKKKKMQQADSVWTKTSSCLWSTYTMATQSCRFWLADVISLTVKEQSWNDQRRTPQQGLAKELRVSNNRFE